MAGKHGIFGGMESGVLDTAIDTAVAKLKTPSAMTRPAVLMIARQIKRKFEGQTFESVADLFEMCEQIDADSTIHVPPKAQEVFARTRHRILQVLLSEYYSQKRAVEVGHLDVETSRAITAEQRMAECVADMLPALKAEGDRQFDQHWLKARFTQGIAEIEPLLRSSQTGVESWEQLRAMFPESVRQRFVIDSSDTQSASFVGQINQYRDIAETLGPETVAQLLVSGNVVKQGGYEGAMKVITPYLGRCATREPSFIDTVHFPEAVLRFQEIEELIYIKLCRYVYQRLHDEEEVLVEQGKRLTGAEYMRHLQRLRSEAEAVVREQLMRDKDALIDGHKQLFERVFAYFDQIGNIRTPERMTDTIGVNGGAHPFPSLRQRIAMHEVGRKQRQLIGFDMAMGKTETAFLAKEHIGARKMLFICLPGMQEEMAGRVNSNYCGPDRRPCYKEGQEPTVGIIRSQGQRLTPEEIHEALQAEVVFCPYSMLTSTATDGRTVVEHIKAFGADAQPDNDDVAEVPFDFMTVDEVHNARKIDGTHTAAVYDLTTGIPQLYEQGYIVSLSGEVAPNRPADIVPQLRIWDRETYGDVKSLHTSVAATDPLVVRNALLNYMLILDRPRDWEQYTEETEYDLHPQEAQIYQAIVNNEDLSANDKLRLLQLCIVNPSLFAAGQEVPSALFDATAAKLRQFLTEEGYGSVMIAENVAKQGVSRPHLKLGTRDTQAFCECLRRHLEEEYGDTVRLRIIDGDTDDALRNQYIEESKESEQPGAKVKTVVFVMSGCVREGRNFSHMHRAIVLEPDYNKPNIAQFVRRFAREGNEDVVVSLMQASDTIHTGVAAHAGVKYGMTTALKFGGTFTKNDLTLFSAENVQQALASAGSVSFLSPLLRYVQSRKEKLNKMFGYLRGKGAQECERFFAEMGHEFAELYCCDWETSHSGNNGRFVAGHFERLEQAGLIQGNMYADVGCGPLVLEQTLGCSGSVRPRRIASVDLCGHMLEHGTKMVSARRPHGSYRPYFVGRGSMSDLGAVSAEHFADGTLDALNCSSAFHYTKEGKVTTKRENKKNVERVRTLMEFNRVLKVGGILVITMPVRTGTLEEIDQLKAEALPRFGFEVLEDYSGDGVSREVDDRGNHFRNITITCRKVCEVDPAEIEELDLRTLKLTRRGETGTKGPRRKPPSGKLHEGYRHTDFYLKDEGFTFDEDLEQQREQDERIARLNAHIVSIRNTYRERGSFDDFTDDDWQALDEQGISHFSFDSTGKRYYFFTFPENPTRLENPLDEDKWGPLNEQKKEDE